MQTLFAFLNAERKIVLLLLLITIDTAVRGQTKWDGEAGDGLWNTALNWTDNNVPAAIDDVLLDHSAVGESYVVTLPSAQIAVTVRSLTILPGNSHTIQVVLPATNTAIPGFTAIGSDYGLVIHRGGVFRNSSGAAAGTPVNISDSIRINNGGLYIHNSSRAHAGNVTVLSTAAGTEQGSFEFDVPGTSGYTVSIAGRAYGNLILSAAAAGGAKSYTSTGTTSVNINGQFRINPGVNYSLNFSGDFIIRGDLLHLGNVFDVSSGSHNNSISIRKNVEQSGTITESGSGFPVIELNGNGTQAISVSGIINESNTLRINNSAGATLQKPLAISHRLELIRGNLKTTSANLLIVHDNAICSGGSIMSFIEGPVKKVGDDDFEFPVGKQGDYAPVSISGTGSSSDEFEAEYFFGNPSMLFGTSADHPSIVRVSRLEYWKLNRTSGTSPKKITMSVRTYSNATLLENLVISRWDAMGNIWRTEGNSGYVGVAFGTVTSNIVHSFGVFTLASIVADQNPLPSFSFSFNARGENDNALFSWKVDSTFQPVSFEIMKSADGRNFLAIKKINAAVNARTYRFVERLTTPGTFYYRVKMIDKDGRTYLSNVEIIFYQQKDLAVLFSYPTLARSNTNLIITASENLTLQLCIADATGRSMRRMSIPVYRGLNNVVLDMSSLAAGTYYLIGLANGNRTNIIEIIKL